MAQRRATDGVETSRGMDSLVCQRRTQDDPEDATWKEQSSELRGCIVIVIAMVKTNH